MGSALRTSLGSTLSGENNAAPNGGGGSRSNAGESSARRMGHWKGPMCGDWLCCKLEFLHSSQKLVVEATVAGSPAMKSPSISHRTVVCHTCNVKRLNKRKAQRWWRKAQLEEVSLDRVQRHLSGFSDPALQKEVATCMQIWPRLMWSN